MTVCQPTQSQIASLKSFSSTLRPHMTTPAASLAEQVPWIRWNSPFKKRTVYRAMDSVKKQSLEKSAFVWTHSFIISRLKSPGECFRRIPCRYIIAALADRNQQESVVSFFHEYYKVSTYNEAFGCASFHLSLEHELVYEKSWFPPLVKKVRGKPKTKRIGSNEK